MSDSRNLVLIGCGGHARSVADVALAAGYTDLFFVDENAREGEGILDFPVFSRPRSEHGNWLYIACAGNAAQRLAQIRELEEKHLTLATIVSPSATIGRGAAVALGCFIGHHAHVGPLTRLGIGSIVNTGAILEHDCMIGAGVHLSINCCVAGYCRLGDRVFIGAGGAVIDRISIADDVTVGAGGVVVADIELPGVYAGVPARRIS